MSINTHEYVTSREELQEFSSVSWQVIIYVFVGILVAVIFDTLKLQGLFPEGVVRAIAGTADTLGLALAALVTQIVFLLRKYSIVLNKVLPNLGDPKAVAWISGGFIGLGLAFIVQALVHSFSSDPYGPVGVVYAFAFSNLDNTIAGLAVLLASLLNQGMSGWWRYWKHPFYYGNAIMLVLIPLVSVLFRLNTGFRPETNLHAGIESGIMDVDSVGAAIIFLIGTRLFNQPVPKIDDDLSGAFSKLLKFIKLR